MAQKLESNFLQVQGKLVNVLNIGSVASKNDVGKSFPKLECDIAIEFGKDKYTRRFEAFGEHADAVLAISHQFGHEVEVIVDFTIDQNPSYKDPDRIFTKLSVKKIQTAQVQAQPAQPTVYPYQEEVIKKNKLLAQNIPLKESPVEVFSDDCPPF